MSVEDHVELVQVQGLFDLVVVHERGEVVLDSASNFSADDIAGVAPAHITSRSTHGQIVMRTLEVGGITRGRIELAIQQLGIHVLALNGFVLEFRQEDSRQLIGYVTGYIIRHVTLPECENKKQSC
jgi:hypothetical protein